MGSSDQFAVNVTPGYDAMGDPLLSLDVQGHDPIVMAADDAEQVALHMLRKVAVARSAGGWFRSLILAGIPAEVARKIVESGGYIPVGLTDTDT